MSEVLQEEDFKVPGVNASVAGPVDPAGGKDTSKAAKKDAGMPMEKLKAVQEDLAALFDGSELTEEFREKATVIFEAAINEKVSGVVASLEEQYEARLTEEVGAIEEALVEKIDSYLDYVVEQWVEENKLAIESGIKAEVVESFMEGLKGLFTEHYVDAPQEKLDILAQTQSEVEELKAKLSASINENIELSKKLETAEAEKAFTEVSEGLAATQIEKLRTLAEGLEYADVSSYKKKLGMIKESYFAAKKVESNAQQQLNEEVAPTPVEEKAVDPVMQKYAAAISRSVQK
jgi:hypothetical protein